MRQFTIANLAALALTSCAEQTELRMDDPNPIATETLVEFMDSIHQEKILHVGTRGEVSGTFNQIPFPGVAKLSGSDYQLVLTEPKERALVAILPQGFTPDLEKEYRLVGRLAAVGHEGLMAGIEVERAIE